MESIVALSRLSALAHDSRLAVFRHLVRVGHDGEAAGDIARAMDLAPNTLSAQLNALSAAGLVQSRREGRSIIYSANYDAIGALILYLMEDCCAGRDEVRRPILESVAASLVRPPISQASIAGERP